MRQLSDIKPNDRIISEQAGHRRAAACHAFWSDAPLNLAYREATGASTFNLKDFTAFVIALPADQFLALTAERHR
jgi:hypothetical protein